MFPVNGIVVETIKSVAVVVPLTPILDTVIDPLVSEVLVTV